MILNLIRTIKKRLFCKKIYVFGDSHTQCFSYINTFYGKRCGYVFDVMRIDGATAHGLNNPNSKTLALQKFSEKISIINNNKTVIFLLGEVDVGFVIWYRALKYNESVEKQYNESINTYTNFLKTIAERGHSIIVMSVPLPTIKDNLALGDVANLRKEVKASQVERTQLTLKYNKELKEICRKNNYIFLDFDKYLLDNNTQLIKNEYLNKNYLDHHLDNLNYANIIIKELDLIYDSRNSNIPASY
ncbi:MAG: hypothetical protein BGO32_03360 [Bacteroidetes bacterium 37-13]|nr:MAG: hypothetical protein BGO32_03360 [Bacteroidetes bacterium 37-13]